MCIRDSTLPGQGANYYEGSQLRELHEAGALSDEDFRAACSQQVVLVTGRVIRMKLILGSSG
eukprot:2431967-Pyramimonas_sp.AAC.1